MSTRTSRARPGQRARLRLAALTLTAALGACGPNVMVRTVSAPEAGALTGRRTFRVVEAPTATNGDSYGINDPMIDNSITSRAVREQIKTAFEARGYRFSDTDADFEIRYNATIAPILDIRGYNYNGNGAYGYCCPSDGFNYVRAVGTYDRSTVIIDAVDPKSDKLLWRGQGTTDVYTDPKRYMKELRSAVKEVAKKFPPQRTMTLASR